MFRTENAIKLPPFQRHRHISVFSKPPQFPGPKPLWTSSNRHGPGFQAMVPLNWEFKPAVGPGKKWILGLGTTLWLVTFSNFSISNFWSFVCFPCVSPHQINMSQFGKWLQNDPWYQNGDCKALHDTCFATLRRCSHTKRVHEQTNWFKICTRQNWMVMKV